MPDESRIPDRLWAVREPDGTWSGHVAAALGFDEAEARRFAGRVGREVVCIGVSPVLLDAAEARVAGLEAEVWRWTVKSEAMRAVLAAVSVKTDLTDEQLMAALEKAESHIRTHGIPREF